MNANWYDNYVVNTHNKRPSTGKVLQGKNSDELWDETLKVIRPVNKDLLRVLCMRTVDDKTVTKTGISDGEFGLYYQADWMHSLKGEKVYIKRDNERYHKCLMFSSKDDSFLGEAILSFFDSDNISKVDKATLKRLKAKSKKDGDDFNLLIINILKALDSKSSEIEFVLNDSQIDEMLKLERKLNDKSSKTLSKYINAELEYKIKNLERKLNKSIYLWESDRRNDERHLSHCKKELIEQNNQAQEDKEFINTF